MFFIKYSLKENYKNNKKTKINLIIGDMNKNSMYIYNILI